MFYSKLIQKWERFACRKTTFPIRMATQILHSSVPLSTLTLAPPDLAVDIKDADTHADIVGEDFAG